MKGLGKTNNYAMRQSICLFFLCKTRRGL